MLPYVDIDLKKIAARVLERAKETCTAKSVLNFNFFYFLFVIRSLFCRACIY